MTPEGRVKAEIKEGLDSLGDDCHYEMPIHFGYGRRSIDFVGCYRGRYFGIEAKAQSRRARPTRGQENTLARIERAGGIAVLARGWADVRDAFKGHKSLES